MRGPLLSPLPLQVRKHGAKLLASMVNGMDDKDDPHNLVALEAMSSLSKLLDHVEERDIQSMLLHIAIRIRPFFDSVRRRRPGWAAFAGASETAPLPSQSLRNAGGGVREERAPAGMPRGASLGAGSAAGPGREEVGVPRPQPAARHGLRKDAVPLGSGGAHGVVRLDLDSSWVGRKLWGG